MNEQDDRLLRQLEALLFTSPQELTAASIRQVLPECQMADLEDAIDRLNRTYDLHNHALRIRRVAGGFQMYALPEFADIIEKLLVTTRIQRLSRAALETLAVIAYKQPVTSPEIERIRGVASDGVLRTLLERELVAITGRAETPGRPLLYGTTDEFLRYFGLNDLTDLPKMEELERLLAQREDEKHHQAPGIDDSSRSVLHLAEIEHSEDFEAWTAVVERRGSILEETQVNSLDELPLLHRSGPESSDDDTGAEERATSRLVLLRKEEVGGDDIESAQSPDEFDIDDDGDDVDDGIQDDTIAEIKRPQHVEDHT